MHVMKNGIQADRRWREVGWGVMGGYMRKTGRS